MELRFITGNEHKVSEAREKLSSLGYEVLQYDMNPPEIQADNPEDVAIFSAEWVKERFDEPFFLEDSGFFVDSLNGFPGVYSAYVFKTLGYMGILRLMEGIEHRGARFMAVIAYHDGSDIHVFRGEVKGAISNEPRGENGFGYDPIFIPEGESRTFAEMSTEEKNMYSHRGRALDELRRYLEEKK